jgi:hypothetical protein
MNGTSLMGLGWNEPHPATNMTIQSLAIDHPLLWSHN